METNNTEEDIRKKEKKLDKNHWMCRVQKIVFNIDAEEAYMGYCPFFWMTVLAIICAPIVLIARYATKPLVIIGDNTSNYIHDKQQQRQNLLKQTPLQPSNLNLINLADGDYENAYDIDNSVMNYSIVNLFYSHTHISHMDACRMELWIRNNPNWRETHLPAALAEAEAHRTSCAIKVARRNKLINTMSAVGPIIFKCLIPLIIAVFAYVIYLLLFKVIFTIGIHNWLMAIMLITFAAALVIAAPIVYDLIVNVIFAKRTKTKHTDDCEEGSGFIIKFFEFISDLIRVTYKKECPLIIWGEETGSITRRENTKDIN